MMLARGPPSRDRQPRLFGRCRPLSVIVGLPRGVLTPVGSPQAGSSRSGPTDARAAECFDRRVGVVAEQAGDDVRDAVRDVASLNGAALGGVDAGAGPLQEPELVAGEWAVGEVHAVFAGRGLQELVHGEVARRRGLLRGDNGRQPFGFELVVEFVQIPISH